MYAKILIIQAFCYKNIRKVCKYNGFGVFFLYQKTPKVRFLNTYY